MSLLDLPSQPSARSSASRPRASVRAAAPRGLRGCALPRQEQVLGADLVAATQHCGDPLLGADAVDHLAAAAAPRLGQLDGAVVQLAVGELLAGPVAEADRRSRPGGSMSAA